MNLKYVDLHDMGFVELINILDAMLPKKVSKPKYRTATQDDINMIT